MPDTRLAAIARKRDITGAAVEMSARLMANALDNDLNIAGWRYQLNEPTLGIWLRRQWVAQCVVDV